MAAYRGLGDDAARVHELDAALDGLARDALAAGTPYDGAATMGWEYLLVTARRR